MYPSAGARSAASGLCLRRGENEVQADVDLLPGHLAWLSNLHSFDPETMINRSHSQTHARPDAKMGRRRKWDYREWTIGPWAGASKRSEKRQATRKRRQRDRTVSEESA